VHDVYGLVWVWLPVVPGGEGDEDGCGEERE
jgi:hypothetical protein